MLKRCVFAAVLVLAALVPALCLSAESRDRHAKRVGGVMICSFFERMKCLDPAVALDMASVNVSSSVFEGLVRFDDDSYRIVPAIARKWFTSDYRTWTFYLNREVKFHDGTECTASSVKFNFDRQLDPKHPMASPPYGRFGVYSMLFGRYGESVLRVEAPEKYKVRIVLAKPDVNFLAKLALPASFIVSPYSLRLLGADFATYPVGTGPYRFSDHRRPSRFVVGRNLAFRGLVCPDSVIFENYSDFYSLMRQLKRGNVDVIVNPSAGELESVGSDGDVRVAHSDMNVICSLLLNPDRREFRTPAERRGVGCLIDRKAIVGSQDMKEAYSFLLPSHSPYREREFSFDRGDIEAFLESVSSERTFDLICPEGPTVYSRDPESIALEIKKSLRAGGVRVSVRRLPDEDFFRALDSKNYDMALWGEWDVSACPDVHFLLMRSLKSFKSSMSANSAWLDEFHALLREARAPVSERERALLYEKADGMLVRNMPSVPVFFKRNSIIYSGRVSDMVYHPSGVINVRKSVISL